ncbi:MAG: bifunctional folylpolyglutamate synthase/dihydrofolate synthase [Chloroflexaceae bacterium]|nr:bifunctional folylpolyglutamate synthase/dihydrofolate synthase [Chloroflexaceae bacterium]
MAVSVPTTYQESLDYLYRFVDPGSRMVPAPRVPPRTLERTHALLAALGNPQAQLSCIIVAGTNGKGSTSAMLESILRAAGYRTGLWTSPHLNSYRERIRVDNHLISQNALVDAVQRLVPVVEAFDQATYGVPSTFELGFALALGFFAVQGVRLAVLEVGIGGRYDCSNVLTPLVSVITSISYDHVPMLGRTLEEIAWDKAGIIKPGVPVVAAPQRPAAGAVVAQVAREVDAPLWTAAEAGLEDEAGQALPYPVAPRPALRGSFQYENARVALGAAMMLRRRGVAVPDAAMERGLAAARCPGRLEIVSHAPLMVLDGAHNEGAVRRLLEALHTEYAFDRLVLVVGMSRDKDIAAVLSVLLPPTHTVILTHAPHPRACTRFDPFTAALPPSLRERLMVVPDLADALNRSRSLARPDDLICVTGSLFVVGAARELLGLAEVCD